MIFWVCVLVALIMAVYVALRLWLPGVIPATGFKIAAKFLWAALALDLLVIFLVSLFLAIFRKHDRIWLYDDLKDGRIFRKGNLSSEFGLLEVFDAEDEFTGKKKIKSLASRNSVLVTKAPSDLPSIFIKKKGRVFALQG